MVEGAITNRASFSVDATYSGGNVIVTWSETGGSNFAGYEIYRTKIVNDEYSGYELATNETANRWTFVALGTNGTSTFTDTIPPTGGTYFYRVGIIAWDEDPDDRTTGNGYPVDYPTAGWDSETSYNNNTDIDEFSGAAMVVIP